MPRLIVGLALILGLKCGALFSNIFTTRRRRGTKFGLITLCVLENRLVKKYWSILSSLPVFFQGQARGISDSSDWWWRWRRNVSFSFSASLSLFSALTLYSHAHLWSIKLSKWFSPAKSKVVYLRCFLKTLCSYCSSNILSVTWFPRCGELCRIRHFFARSEPAKLITKIINKIIYNYRAEKKRPYQRKSLASPLGVAPIEPFPQLAASFMSSHALLVHIKLSHIHTN